MVVRRCFAFVFLGTAVSPSGVSSCGCFQIWVGGVLRAVLCTTIEPFSLRCASLPTLLPANVLPVGSGGSWVLVVVGTRLGSPCLVGGVWFPLAILCVCVVAVLVVVGVAAVRGPLCWSLCVFFLFAGCWSCSCQMVRPRCCLLCCGCALG